MWKDHLTILLRSWLILTLDCFYQKARKDQGNQTHDFLSLALTDLSEATEHGKMRNRTFYSGAEVSHMYRRLHVLGHDDKRWAVVFLQLFGKPKSAIVGALSAQATALYLSNYS